MGWWRRRLGQEVVTALHAVLSAQATLTREVIIMSEHLEALRAAVTELATLTDQAVAILSAPPAAPTVVGDDPEAVGVLAAAVRSAVETLRAALPAPPA